MRGPVSRAARPHRLRRGEPNKDNANDDNNTTTNNKYIYIYIYYCYSIDNDDNNDTTTPNNNNNNNIVNDNAISNTNATHRLRHGARADREGFQSKGDTYDIQLWYVYIIVYVYAY